MKPTLMWMLRHPARIVAFGFGSGLIRPAPGTWGTLLGWLTFVILARWVPGIWMLALIAAAYALGIYACGKAGRDLGVADHGGIVWDEVVAIWLVLAMVPDTPASHVAGFLLFRFFDILKPQPIRYFDAKWKNGFGVMFDDLLAALFTLLVFSLYLRMVD